MTRRPIAETTLAGLRPTGVAGRRVLECWDQIDGYLRGGPGEELADLFAEPVIQGGRIVWFAPEGGSVQRFAELDAGGQEALRAALADRLSRLAEETSRLVRSSSAAARLIGETLERAQQVPDPVEDSLFAVDGRPVLINWSMEPEGRPPPVEPLKEFVRRARPPEPVVTSGAGAVPPGDPSAAVQPMAVQPVVLAVRRPLPWWWLLWLLAAITFAAIYHVLLLGCGLWGGGGLVDYCPAPVSAAPIPPPPSTEDATTQALLAEIAQLEQRLNRAPRCPVPPAAPPAATPAPPPPATPKPPDEFERRMGESGAASGELTITLIWNTPSDLDLFVICPSGAVVGFNNTQACGGRLDVDANYNNVVPNPVENIYFTGANLEQGTYQVVVKNNLQRGSQTNPFQVRVKKGTSTTYHDGVAPTNSRQINVTTTTMP